MAQKVNNNAEDVSSNDPNFNCTIHSRPQLKKNVKTKIDKTTSAIHQQLQITTALAHMEGWVLHTAIRTIDEGFYNN